jgi:hypothetical protein
MLTVIPHPTSDAFFPASDSQNASGFRGKLARCESL